MALLNIKLNVQGLNSLPKHTKAFRSFSKLNTHVVCLQQTHFSSQSYPKFFSHKYPQVYTSLADTKQRGILIAFYHTTPFTLQTELKDPEGRYILLLSGLLQDTEVTIVSFYAQTTSLLTLKPQHIFWMHSFYHVRGLIIIWS